MKIDIIKEKRKTISLKLLSSDKAILKVPSRLSQEKIDEFLQSKQRWLEKHTKMMWQKENFSKTFDFSQYLYINGESIGKTSEIVIGFDKLDLQAKKRAIKKYGKDNFSIKQIDHAISKEEAFEKEAFWINYYNSTDIKYGYKIIFTSNNKIYIRYTNYRYFIIYSCQFF